MCKYTPPQNTKLHHFQYRQNKMAYLKKSQAIFGASNSLVCFPLSTMSRQHIRLAITINKPKNNIAEKRNIS